MSDKKNSENKAQIQTLLIETTRNKEELSERGQRELNKVIQYLKNHPDSIIKITGQSTGEDPELAKNRAKMVFEILTDQKIDSNRIVVTEKPILNKEPSNQNRSVKLEIISGKVNMAFNGQDLIPKGTDDVKKIYDYWNRNQKNIIFLTGGATQQGLPENNRKLAMKRAQEVKKELMKLGVPLTNIAINPTPNLQATRASVEVKFSKPTITVHSENYNLLINIGTKKILERENINAFKKRLDTQLEKIQNLNTLDEEKYKLQNSITLRLRKEGFKTDDPISLQAIKNNIRPNI